MYTSDKILYYVEWIKVGWEQDYNDACENNKHHIDFTHAYSRQDALDTWKFKNKPKSSVRIVKCQPVSQKWYKKYLKEKNNDR